MLPPQMAPQLAPDSPESARQQAGHPVAIDSAIFQEVHHAFLRPALAQAQESATRPTITHLLMVASKAMSLLEGRPLRHGIRVAVLAGHIARLLRLEAREISSVVFAGLIHDIGLARVAAEVATRLPQGPHGLTEKDVFKVHPLLASNVLTHIKNQPLPEPCNHLLQMHPQAAKGFVEAMYLSADVSDIIAGHHELMDGSGYPMGLKGDNIPKGARILALADAADCIMDDVAGLTTRQQVIEGFLDIKAVGKYDEEAIKAFRHLTLGHDGDLFLKKLFSYEVEEMLHECLPERTTPLTGAQLLRMVHVIARMTDSLMPVYLNGNANRCADIAVSIAQQLGIAPAQCGELAIAALLHDIGMVAVPLPILLKPEPLSQDEWSVIYDHPRYTAEIIQGVPGFESLALWASEHHERMNGSGYHCQKKGFEISIAGRIIAIADVYTALTSARPYRTHAHEPLDAIPVLGQGRYRLFDNQLVSVLRNVVLENRVVSHR